MIVVYKNKNKTNNNKEVLIVCFNVNTRHCARNIYDMSSKRLNDFNYSSPYYY